MSPENQPQSVLQAPACKMEPRSGYIMQLNKPPTHPPNHRISWKSILDSQQSRKSGSFYVVRCPHPIDKVCALSPPHTACIWFSHNPIVTSSKKHVPCPPLSVNTFFVRCLPPKFISLPWTLWLCLGFWAKLRIWQVPACKMKPSSTCILECGTPSWACFFFIVCHPVLIFQTHS